MPELPEVETIVRNLNKILLHKTIRTVHIINDKILQNVSKENFLKIIENKKIIKINRYGKMILFTLSENWFLFVHLRMTGHLLLKDNFSKHIHTKLFFDNETLFYDDPRRFGRFYLTQNREKYIKNLGVDPLSNTFTPLLLANLLIKSKRAIKSVLLSQNVIAGIGNIYADEILWLTKIHPLTSACNIVNHDELFKAIKSALLKGIKNKGTSLGKAKQNFCDIFGHFGKNSDHLKVYNRENERCFQCSSLINRMKINGRSSYFCPNCQPHTTCRAL
jgi:formamidopyrimidine-DNA glycosylase